jgi:hypothetical protein
LRILNLLRVSRVKRTKGVEDMDEEIIEKVICGIEDEEKISLCKPWYEELEECNKSLDPELHQKIVS